MTPLLYRDRYQVSRAQRRTNSPARAPMPGARSAPLETMRDPASVDGSQQAAASFHPVVVSLSVYEGSSYVCSLLRHVVDAVRNDTLVVVHVGNQSWSPDELGSLVTVDERVRVNPTRVQTRRKHGSVFQSQILNLQFLRRRNVIFDVVVFASSDMLWCRHGVEEVVRRERQSVLRVTSDSACRSWNSDMSRNFPHTDLRTCGKGSFVKNTRSRVDEWQGMQRAWQLMTQAWPGMTYAVQSKHEGSFYAYADVMRLLAADIPEAIFATPVYMEELILQSWMANFASVPSVPPNGILLIPMRHHLLANPDAGELIRRGNKTLIAEACARHRDHRWPNGTWAIK